MKYNSYEDRLETLGLQSLELRRLHFDLTMLYKIAHNLVDLSFEHFFVLTQSRYNLRQHTLTHCH